MVTSLPKLVLQLKHHQQLRDLGLAITEYANKWPAQERQKQTHIWIPLEQAHLMIEKIDQLSRINFNVNKQTCLLNMDRIKEVEGASQYTQLLYTHRVPGLLYGYGQSALYLAYTKIQDGNKNNRLASTDISLQPQLLIAQHFLHLNEFHAWRPSLFSIQIPIIRVPKFIQTVRSILAHPSVRDQKQQGQIKKESTRGKKFLEVMQISENYWQQVQEDCNTKRIT